MSYKVWKRCIDPALQLLAGKLANCEPEQLRLKRSANHSNFPECDECQERRKELHAALRQAGANPAVIAELNAKVLAHRDEWQADRTQALRLKYAAFQLTADTLYECDDKCGSFWQQLPVDPTGRDSKRGDRAKYKFAIQANVVVGPGGVQRFSAILNEC